MKKMKLFIISLPLILMLLAIGYKNNNSIESNDTLVTLNCNLNNKLYSYEIIYDKNDNLYKIKPNNSLLIEIQKSSEEELENIIKNIFTTKGGSCITDNNLVINIDLEENKILKQASKNEEEAAIDEEK